MKKMNQLSSNEMSSSDKRKKLVSGKSCFVMKFKIVEIVKEVIACDISQIVQSKRLVPLIDITDYLRCKDEYKITFVLD